MTNFLDKLKRNVEEGYSTVRDNAINLKDIAEDYGKITKLKFELHQNSSMAEKKFALLGKTVFPYLIENNYEGLKEHEGLPVVLDDIKNINNKTELIQHTIKNVMVRDVPESISETERERLSQEINQLENEIENHLKELKAVKQAIDK